MSRTGMMILASSIGFCHTVKGFRPLIHHGIRCCSSNSNPLEQGAASTYHVPVMLKECLDHLNIKSDGVYVDCTLGGGGHSCGILQMGGRVVAIDQDQDAIDFASRRLSSFIETGRLEIHKNNFRNIADVVKSSSIILNGKVDGVLMDLGVSSYQIDEKTRGFAYRYDGPLDMRMNRDNMIGNEITAADIVNTWSSTDIANVIYEYGEESRSRQIAREIILSRPINTTMQLSECISRVIPFNQRQKVLSRCFQAFRIAVNDEMGALVDSLNSMRNVINIGGRLVVLSYHSLEDRLIKNLIRNNRVGFDGIAQSGPKRKESKDWELIVKGSACNDEVEDNGRSRSAKLRVAQRN